MRKVRYEMLHDEIAQAGKTLGDLDVKCSFDLLIRRGGFVCTISFTLNTLDSNIMRTLHGERDGLQSIFDCNFGKFSLGTRALIILSALVNKDLRMEEKGEPPLTAKKRYLWILV